MVIYCFPFPKKVFSHVRLQLLFFPRSGRLTSWCPLLHEGQIVTTPLPKLSARVPPLGRPWLLPELCTGCAHTGGHARPCPGARPRARTWPSGYTHHGGSQDQHDAAGGGPAVGEVRDEPRQDATWNTNQLTHCCPGPTAASHPHGTPRVAPSLLSTGLGPGIQNQHSMSP